MGMILPGLIDTTSTCCRGQLGSQGWMVGRFGLGFMWCVALPHGHRLFWPMVWVGTPDI